MAKHITESSGEWKFIEAWIDATSYTPGILMLVLRDSGEYQVIDPAENYNVIFTSSSYQEAMLWLEEDEYVQIKGRRNIEDT